MQEVGANTCTDVTGFGLFGHLVQLVRRSEVTAVVFAGALPAFAEAVEYLGSGIVPGAVERNREYVGDDLEIVGQVDAAIVDLCFDAQTSGGLLISVPAERAEGLVARLKEAGTLAAAVIGRISEESEGKIELRAEGNAQEAVMAGKEAEQETRSAVSGNDGDEPCCCGEAVREAEAAEGHSCCEAQAQAAADNTETAALFGKFMAGATAGSDAIGEREKELIVWSLVVLARCGPCVKIHYNKALKMGISKEELEEAAWLAVSMGGAPVMMFYKEAMKEIEAEGKCSCC